MSAPAIDPKPCARRLAAGLNAARFMSNTTLGVVPDGEIVRAWKSWDESNLNDDIWFLENYCDPANKKPQKYVLNPIAGRKKRNGIWRVYLVEVERDPRDGTLTLMQRLRKGWATAIDWTEARVEAQQGATSNDEKATTAVGATIDNTTSANPSSLVTFRFPNIAPEKVNELTAELLTTTTQLQRVVEGNIYVAGYKTIAVSNRREQDGTHSILLTVAHPTYTIKDARDYGGTSTGAFGQDVTRIWRVPKHLAQDIITTFTSTGVGRSTFTEFSKEAEMVDITLVAKRVTTPATGDTTKTKAYGYTQYNCSGNKTSHPFFDVPDPNVTAYTLGGATWPLATGTTYEKAVRNNGDGTYDVIITVEVATARLIGGTTSSDIASAGLLISKNLREEVRRRINLDYDPASVTPYNISAPPTGTVYVQRITINGNCTRNAETDAIIGALQDTGWIPYTEFQGTSYVRKFYNMPLGESGNTSSEATVYGVIAGMTSATNNQLWLDPDPNGLYNGYAVRNARLDTTAYEDTTWQGFGQSALKNDNRDWLYDTQGRRFVVNFYRTSSQAKAKAFAQGDSVAAAWSGSPPAFATVKTGCHVLAGIGGHVTDWYYRGLGRWLAVRVDGYTTDFPQKTG